MNNKELEYLKQNGFVGFVSITNLTRIISQVTNDGGVYVILRESDNQPCFLERGTGGFFKGKDPNVSKKELQKNWNDGSSIVYIGKAGHSSGLRNRLTQLLRFGQGEPVGHWGGRLIWQLSDSSDLIVCWKVIQNKTTDPEDVEKKMILEYKAEIGQFPFANLRL